LTNCFLAYSGFLPVTPVHPSLDGRPRGDLQSESFVTLTSCRLLTTVAKRSVGKIVSKMTYFSSIEFVLRFRREGPYRPVVARVNLKSFQVTSCRIQFRRDVVVVGRRRSLSAHKTDIRQALAHERRQPLPGPTSLLRVVRFSQ